MNVYFDNKVRELPGFKSKPYGDGSGDDMRIGNIKLWCERDRLHAIWTETDSIPENLRDVVNEITFYDSIPQMSHRESGIYRHKSAECELTPDDHGNAKREKPIYRLKASGKKVEDIQELIHKIKTGTIRPAESYEANQGGLSGTQLQETLVLQKRKIEQLQGIVEESDMLRSENEILSRAKVLAEERVRATHSLAIDLENEAWPWCSKATMATRINLALNEGNSE